MTTTPVSAPFISVLMSCYNAGKWLHDAIDSVLAQTFKNYEFILVDDGSTDDTWNIIQSYRDRDDRIVAVSKKNTGLADSLNVGIARAKGAWIARLDADDLCEPTRFEEQVNFVRNHSEVILLGSGFVEIDENYRAIKTHMYPSDHRKLVYHLEHLMRFFPHSSAFYRVDVARSMGGYNTRFRRSQDWQLWLELASRGGIACLPNPLVRIRKHTGQISHDDSGRRQICDATAATVCYFLRKAGYKDPSADPSTDDWNIFLQWVESRIEMSGTFVRSKAWTEARAEFFTTRRRPIGLLRFGGRLLQSGHARTLIFEKLFGSSLPQRLAPEWMNKVKS